MEEAYVFADEQQFTVRKTSLFFADDGFTVYDSTGCLVFRVDSYSPDAGRDSDEVVLMDSSGSCILTVSRKVIYAVRFWIFIHSLLIYSL